MITKEQFKQVMDEDDALSLSDSAHWALVHERLGLDEVFDIIAAHPEFLSVMGVSNTRVKD